MIIQIPTSIIKILSVLEAAGFEAFVVGGCVRDIFLGKEPNDWDVTTNAKPAEIMQLFPDSVYENQFGTVGVKGKRMENDQAAFGGEGKNKESKNFVNNENETDESAEKTEIIEVTTYRIESKYTDKRHPDEIRFAKTLEEDLSRRDFTVNAMAVKLKSKILNLKTEKNASAQEGLVVLEEGDYELVDLYKGKADLEKKVIRAVGDGNERFNEDALRMMRAVRFAVQLSGNKLINNEIENSKQASLTEVADWQIEKETVNAIKKNAANLKFVSQERIHDELEKIILSDQPARGIELLRETGLLQYIMPELLIGVDLVQGHHHYDGPYRTVYKHLVASLEKCPSKKLDVRLAALLHDVGKPATARGEDKNVTFYNHEYAGAHMAKDILERLRFPKKVIARVTMLVRNHMFYYNVDEVGESGVRRVVRKVGVENIKDLIDVRIADRLGSGVAKAVPYKLRHFQYMVDRVSQDAVSVKQLKVNGNDLMQELGLEPSPKIGAILDVLLARVIEQPSLNTRICLLELATELQKSDLAQLRLLAKQQINQKNQEEDKKRKSQHRVG